MKIFGFIPARMAASRFPGKPMYKIHGRPMLEHVYARASMYKNWDSLSVATCDEEIFQFCKAKGYTVLMTGSHHTRALDRVAEAAGNSDIALNDDDIIVCVQGDEPMMKPDMIDAVLEPLISDPKKSGTILAMSIVEEDIWKNPDTVKLIFNASGEVLYTSRTPIPYCKGAFDENLGARRIYGIFAFRWKYLKAFTAHPETRLEILESCDSNRILDMPFRQYIAPYPYVRSYSVDSPDDIHLVESSMKQDPLWDQY